MSSEDPTIQRCDPPIQSASIETQKAGPVALTHPNAPSIGMRVGEFLLLEQLGVGSFGRVFLADQEGLNRRVALKVAQLRGMSEDEGKALGGLEHDHIVKVYAAFTPPGTEWHCLCLQYVPGADLRAVLDELYRPGAPPLSGRAILAAVDAVGRRDGAFDPAALRDRDVLAADDFPQAICRLGGHLAEALAFAHAKGVLHCDIKPGNILLTPYGRPLLADFNVAFDRARASDPDARLGGTVSYMAPEYLAALQDGVTGAVDERCDIYSLGVVLHELATGKKPIRTDGEIAPGPLAAAPLELAAVVRRCLQSDPTERYQTAADLAAALSGAWHLLAAHRALARVGRPGRVGRWLTARPAAALLLIGLLPHVPASVVNIGYNAAEIELTATQRAAFESLIVGYNLLVYPACAGILLAAFRGINRRLPGLARANGTAVVALRRRVLRMAWLVIGLGCIGWFPGAVLFPLGIDLLAGPVAWQVYAQFAISFVLSGLIGVVFSYLGVAYILFRSLLPQLVHPDTFRAGAIGKEVRPLVALLGPCLMLACAVPLTGAVLLVLLNESATTLGFRLLVAGLIGLGMAGVLLASAIASRLFRLAAVWVRVGGSADGEPAS